MSTLVQIAVLVALVGIVALVSFLFIKRRESTVRWFDKYLGFLEDEETECPDWADHEKWKESLK